MRGASLVGDDPVPSPLDKLREWFEKTTEGIRKLRDNDSRRPRKT